MPNAPVVSVAQAARAHLDPVVALLVSRLAGAGGVAAHQLLRENMFPNLLDAQVASNTVKGARVLPMRTVAESPGY